MKIDVAVSSDIPELCDLLDTLFTQETEFEPDREVQRRGLQLIIENEAAGNILVAREAGKVIGMISILYTVSTALGAWVGILEDTVVAESRRSSGVGSRLLEAALEFARQKGCRRITLLTDGDNEEAHSFYRKHGFTASTMVVFRQLLDEQSL